MQQRKAESNRLYLGRLKGAARHCDFKLPPGETSYTDKMVMQTLVQGLEDAAITKYTMDLQSIFHLHRPHLH